MLGQAGRKKKLCFEYIKHDMNGFCFHDETFLNNDKMGEHFKNNHGKEEHMYYKWNVDESCEKNILKKIRDAWSLVELI